MSEEQSIIRQMIASSGDIMVGGAALVTALGGIFVTYCKTVKEKARREQAENELAYNAAALDMGVILQQWSVISDISSMLIQNTNVDRIMLLRAWNGKWTPKWTTSVYQFRGNGDRPVNYEHFELDGDYVERLRSTIRLGSQYYVVDNMPPCEIKSVYEAEGVKASYWQYISAHKDGGGPGVAHIYISYATHSDEGLTAACQTKCRVATGTIKGLALAIAEPIDLEENGDAAGHQ